MRFQDNKVNEVSATSVCVPEVAEKPASWWHGGAVALVLLMALLSRIVFPEPLMQDGGDIPGLAMASMRLFDTSPFVFQPARSNTFVQIAAHSHGYTHSLVPFLAYLTGFEVFGLPVTEANLTYIHSIIGVASLFCVYLCLRTILTPGVALASLLFLSCMPMLMGVHRAFAAHISLDMLFFWSGLACLHKFLSTEKGGWRWSYAGTACLFAGCGNHSFLGMAFQALYVFLYPAQAPFPGRLRLLLRTFVHWSVVLVVGLPIAGMIAFAFASPRLGIAGGPILHALLNRSESVGRGGFDLGGLFLNLFWSLGPMALLFPFSLVLLRSGVRPAKERPLLTLLWVMALLYALLIGVSGRAATTSHVLVIAVPIAVLGILPFMRRPDLRPVLVLMMLIQAAFVGAVFYGRIVDIDHIAGVRIPRPYGYAYAADSGLKTLSYLVRSGEVPVSSVPIDPADKPGARRYGLFMDYEGGWFYLADAFHDWCEHDLKKGLDQAYERYLLVHRPSRQSARNQFILAEATRRRLHQVGSIVGRDGVLMVLYSNVPTAQSRDFDVDTYNVRFDGRYANLEHMARHWLGAK